MYEAGYEAMYEARDPQHWNQKVEISMKSDRDGMPNDVRNSSEPSTSAPSFTEITSESTVSNEEQGMVALHIEPEGKSSQGGTSRSWKVLRNFFQAFFLEGFSNNLFQ